MNGGIGALAWPLSRLGEGIEELARRAGLHPSSADATTVPEALDHEGVGELDRWIEWACDRLGLEAEPVEAAASEFGQMLLGAGPALIHFCDASGSHILLLLKSKSGILHLIGPDLSIGRCPVEMLRMVLCERHEAPIITEVDQLLSTAGVPKNRRNQVRSAILRKRLAAVRIGGCWILRLPPTADFWRQLMYDHLPFKILLMLGIFVLVYGVEILGWSVIGQGALNGRLDIGWLTAWALLVLSLIPLQLLGHWLGSTLALDTGRILKQRLLAGALRMDVESVRHQGAGQLLGRVIESQALESLALNGGLTLLVQQFSF